MGSLISSLWSYFVVWEYCWNRGVTFEIVELMLEMGISFGHCGVLRCELIGYCGFTFVILDYC
jgi:hypothetical protein